MVTMMSLLQWTNAPKMVHLMPTTNIVTAADAVLGMASTVVAPPHTQMGDLNLHHIQRVKTQPGTS